MPPISCNCNLSYPVIKSVPGHQFIFQTFVPMSYKNLVRRFCPGCVFYSFFSFRYLMSNFIV